MNGFILKKSFFDFWDNLFKVILMNAGYTLIFLIFGSLSFLLKFNFYAFISVFLIGAAFLFIYSGAVSLTAWDIINHKEMSFSDFFRYIKDSWKTSLLFFALFAVYIFIMISSLPFYISMKNIFGVICASLLFWLGLAFVLMFQYVFPVYSQLDKSFKKSVKKSFLILMDNPLFSIYLFLVSCVLFIISFFTGFLIPGVGYIMIWVNTGLKIKLYKYDYLEKYPDTPRNKIPYKDLYKEDDDLIGKRSLKNLIFPWRD